jgi:hypothetical protein
LNAKHLLDLRLANYELAEKTFDAFASKFSISSISFSFGDRRLYREMNDSLMRHNIRVTRDYNKFIAAYKAWPRFDLRVKELTLKHFRTLVEMSMAISRHVGMMKNLRSLRLIKLGVEVLCPHKNHCSRVFANIKLPQLESFTVKGNQGDIKVECLVSVFLNHRETLKSVELLDLMLSDNEKFYTLEDGKPKAKSVEELRRRISKEEDFVKGEWVKVLKALKCLSPEAAVGLFRSFVWTHLKQPD